jgi:hypothetical protein
MGSNKTVEDSSRMLLIGWSTKFDGLLNDETAPETWPFDVNATESSVPSATVFTLCIDVGLYDVVCKGNVDFDDVASSSPLGAAAITIHESSYIPSLDMTKSVI